MKCGKKYFLDPLEKWKHSGQNFVVATIDCSFVATLFGHNLLQNISSIYKKKKMVKPTKKTKKNTFVFYVSCTKGLHNIKVNAIIDSNKCYILTYLYFAVTTCLLW